MLACIVNFSGNPHRSYRVGLPMPGRWAVVINTDAFVYGGSGVGNLGTIEAVDEPWHGQPASAVVTLPPLGVLWLTPQDAPALEDAAAAQDVPAQEDVPAPEDALEPDGAPDPEDPPDPEPESAE